MNTLTDSSMSAERLTSASHSVIMVLSIVGATYHISPKPTYVLYIALIILNVKFKIYHSLAMYRN